MSEKRNAAKRGLALVQHCRLAVQIAALTFTLAGSFALMRGMGLPRWAFLGLVVLSGMFMCGWVCPFGTIQEWLRFVGRKATGVTLRIPDSVNRYLLLSRYALPLTSGVLVLTALNSRRTFVEMVTGTGVETAAYVALGAVLLLSLFMDRPFCKYLCGHGAMSGLASVLRIFAIKRDREKCVSCGRCSRSCQMGVEVAKANAVRDPHCINCGVCLTACPVPGALKPGFAVPGMDDVRALKDKYLSADGKSGKRDAA